MNRIIRGLSAISVGIEFGRLGMERSESQRHAPQYPRWVSLRFSPAYLLHKSLFFTACFLTLLKTKLRTTAMFMKFLARISCIVVPISVCSCGYIYNPDFMRTYKSPAGPEVARVHLYSYLTKAVVYPDSTCADRKNQWAGMVEKNILMPQANLGINVPDSLNPAIQAPEIFEEFAVPAERPVTVSIEFQAVPNYGVPSIAYGCRTMEFSFFPKKGASYQLWYRPMGEANRCEIGLQELVRNPGGEMVAVEVAESKRSHRCDT